MRISTAQIYTQGVKSFGVQQTKLAVLQEQISTGVRINKPSDDAAASARILELEQTVSLNEQYQTNINLTENRLNPQETSLTSVENVIQRIRELTLQANNATQSLESRKAIAFEVDELQKELISLSNTIDANGDYLFAGHQSKIKPFSTNITGSISHVEFNGDQGQRLVNISQSRQINTDTSGSAIFMQIPAAMALNESADSANSGTGVLAPAHVYDSENYVADSYQITFDTVSSAPETLYSVQDSAGVTVASGNYSDSQDIEFMGIRTSVTGVPANGDSFTVSQGQYRDMFSIVSGLAESLRSSASSAETAGTYTFGSALTVFDYSTDSASFDVDGLNVNLNSNYTDLDGVTTSIQAQLDSLAVGEYSVTNDGSTVSIAKVVTSASSTAPVVNNFNGDTDLNATTIADFTAAGTTVSGKDSSSIHSDIAQVLLDLDTAFGQVLEARTSIGGRLNALQSQFDDNESTILVTQKTLSVIRDTDLAEAISQLTLEQTTLDAAQAVFARITSSSLFNFLR